MLKALINSIKRMLLWVFSPNYVLRKVDGWPRIVRITTPVNQRQMFLHPAVIFGQKSLMLITNMPKGESWRVHRVSCPGGKDLPYVELVGMLGDEWCLIKETTSNIEVSNEVLSNSFYPALARLPDFAWNNLDADSIAMIMKDVIIERWKKYPEHQLGIIVRTFHYKMPYNQDGVDGLYSAIDGTIFTDGDGKVHFATYMSEDYFSSLPVKEEYVIEVDRPSGRLVYTISDCPEDWHVHKIDHADGEITYLRTLGDRHYAFRRYAKPGSYVQAMAPEHRNAVLSDWAIPKREVDEIHRMANMSSAELLDPIPPVVDANDDFYAGEEDDDVTELADEQYGPSEPAVVKKVDVSNLWSEGAAAWDRLPKYDRPIHYRTELREWVFIIKIDDFPINAEINYVVPAQYKEDGPIEAVISIREKGGKDAFVAPRLYPVVEMHPIDNVVKFGDDYRTNAIVINSRGWRYNYTDTYCPNTCKVVGARLVRDNPTGKPLITFEYEHETGPMKGRIAQRRFVVPTQVTRAGSNNKRKAGKRRPGIGKRR